MLYVYNILRKQTILAFQRLRQSLSSILSLYRHTMALYKLRCQLAALDDRQLDDIGVSRADMEAECARPIGQDKAPWIPWHSLQPCKAGRRLIFPPLGICVAVRHHRSVPFTTSGGEARHNARPSLLGQAY